GRDRVVTAFGQEERETNRFGGKSLKGSAARIRAAFLESVFGGLLGLATAGGTAITLLIGVAHVRAGSLTLGELLLVMAYLAQLYGPLTLISRKAASIQTHLASKDPAIAPL